MKILLTNDDSLDSPLFLFAVDYFQAMGDVKAVVPAEEQSWKGKAMTRFGTRRVERLDGFACETYSFSGTPADCANFGIYHLFDGGKPDLVISGVNMGSNSGLSFTLSSGTVGAALEANIAGLPGVALSQVLPRQVFRQWAEDRAMQSDVRELLFERCRAMLDQVFAFLNGQVDFLSDPVTWNVNMPAEPSDDWRVIQTVLGHTFYTSCFEASEDGYYHNIDQPEVEERAGTDGVVLREGHVSVTRLDIRTLGQ